MTQELEDTCMHNPYINKEENIQLATPGSTAILKSTVTWVQTGNRVPQGHTEGVWKKRGKAVIKWEVTELRGGADAQK